MVSKEGVPSRMAKKSGSDALWFSAWVLGRIGSNHHQSIGIAVGNASRKPSRDLFREWRYSRQCPSQRGSRDHGKSTTCGASCANRSGRPAAGPVPTTSGVGRGIVLPITRRFQVCAGPPLRGLTPGTSRCRYFRGLGLPSETPIHPPIRRRLDFPAAGIAAGAVQRARSEPCSWPNYARLSSKPTADDSRFQLSSSRSSCNLPSRVSE